MDTSTAFVLIFSFKLNYDGFSKEKVQRLYKIELSLGLHSFEGVSLCFYNANARYILITEKVYNKMIEFSGWWGVRCVCLRSSSQCPLICTSILIYIFICYIIYISIY